MIETQARVIDTEPGFAWIESERRSACGHCSASSGCGVSALASLFGTRRQQLRLPDPLGLRPGDEVLVGLPERALLGAALAAYFLPLLTMLFTALLAAGLGAGQGLRALAALAGLVAGLWLAGRRARRAGGCGLPVILGQPPGGSGHFLITTASRGDKHE